MLQIVIFSFNRALQLDTLITSIIEKWQLPHYNIDVIYNTSDNDFQKGYDLLVKKYNTKTNIVFNGIAACIDAFFAGCSSRAGVRTRIRRMGIDACPYVHRKG